MTALEELTAVARDVVNPHVENWRRQGKRVVGFFCSYVPEEILYAGGILPYRVRPTKCQPATHLADTYLSHLNCTFVRSCLQFAYEGKYEFLDGFVFTDSCDHIRRLYDVMRATGPFPFMRIIGVPHKSGDEATAYYRGEIAGFRKEVEQHFGVEITEAKLKDAIDLYNETRDLLKRLYALRQEKAPPLTGAETLNVIIAATSMPREQYNGLLSRLLGELSARKGISNYRARLMISGGGGCDDSTPFEMMEDIGGLIVTDTLCFGSRYFMQPTVRGGDLLMSLARSYIDRPSCGRMADKVIERAEFMKTLIHEARVDGVVYQRMRYCDLWGGQLFYLRKVLKESNMPLLDIEREYHWGDVGQVRTRTQAFLEMIEERKNGN